MNIPYAAYLVVLFALMGSILVTPLIALHGPKPLASLLYNLYVPTCHQWIYRSFCVFYDGQNHWVGDCIKKNQTAVIATEFTVADHTWDGVFNYSRDQIGLNRAERVEYGNVVGYKFPNDARNLGIYGFALIAGVVLPFVWKDPRVPHIAFFILGILPLAIDGTGQLVGLWESTNIVRLITGALAGMVASIYVYAMLNTRRK